MRKVFSLSDSVIIDSSPVPKGYCFLCYTKIRLYKQERGIDGVRQCQSNLVLKPKFPLIQTVEIHSSLPNDISMSQFSILGHVYVDPHTPDGSQHCHSCHEWY